MNKVIKDMAGTAVSLQEMQRQMIDLPNAGQGVFDGDAPPTFEAKMNNQIKWNSAAVARSRYLRSKGFVGRPWEAGVAVEDMPQIINQRGAEIEQQLRQQNPNADPMMLKQAIKTKIKQEFGI